MLPIWYWTCALGFGLCAAGCPAPRTEDASLSGDSSDPSKDPSAQTLPANAIPIDLPPLATTIVPRYRHAALADWSTSCDTLADWDTVWQCARAIDSTYGFSTSGAAGGPYALQLTPTAGTNAVIDDYLTEPVDFSDGSDTGTIMGFYLHIRYYMPAASMRILDNDGTVLQEGIYQLRVYLRDTFGTEAYWVVFLVIDSGGRVYNEESGWHDIWLAQDALHTGNVALDFRGIDRVRVRCYHGLGSSQPCYFDRIEFPERISRPKLLICFDDSHYTQYEACGYLTHLGLPANLFTISGLVGTHPGHLSWEQVYTLHSCGHLIANHCDTITSGDAWKITSAQRKIEEVTACADKLCSHGMPDGARIFASPGGAWQATDDDTLLGTYLDHVRLTRQSMTLGTSLYCVGNPRKSWCSVLNLIDRATDTITGCQDFSAVSIVTFHEIDGAGDNPTMAEFRQFADELATARDEGYLDVITFVDLMSITE
jgi:hypothetical protein